MISESITSIGLGGPILSQSSQATGSSPTSSFADTSRRLNSKIAFSGWSCADPGMADSLQTFVPRRRSLHLELKPLLTDLKLGQRFDGDLWHPQPQPVRRLVMLSGNRIRPSAIHQATRQLTTPSEFRFQDSQRTSDVYFTSR